MNEKEVGEIRRHMRRDRSNMTAIYGCYVNDNKEIIAQYRASTGIMSGLTFIIIGVPMESSHCPDT